MQEEQGLHSCSLWVRFRGTSGIQGQDEGARQPPSCGDQARIAPDFTLFCPESVLKPAEFPAFFRNSR